MSPLNPEMTVRTVEQERAHLEKKSFVVIYRSGGELTFQWRRVLELYTREEAEARKQEIERAGFKTLIHNAKLLESIGMPETFDGNWN